MSNVVTSIGVATGTGNAVTSFAISGNTIYPSKGLTAVT
jgi:hypothetical protein